MELNQLVTDMTCASAPLCAAAYQPGQMDLQSDLVLPKY